MRTRERTLVLGLTMEALLGIGLTRPTSAEDWPYALTIDGQLEVKSPGQLKPQPLETSCRMRYTLSPVEGGQELTIRGVDLTVSSEGKMISNVQLSRAEATFQQGEHKPDTQKYDRAPKELQEILGQFGTPIARIETDPKGTATGHTLLIEGASTFVENGIVENARLFHAASPSGRETWDAPCRLSMGEGQFAAGSLTYRTSGAGPDGTIKVEVSGELKPNLKPGGDIRDGSYKVSGEQFFDPEREAWVAGHWTIDVTLNMQAEGQATGTATGTMDLRLEADPTPTEAVTPAGVSVDSLRPAPG